MAWRDKIDGWASYSRKWWGPLVSILLKILKGLFFTDGGILVIFLFIALAVAASLSCFYTIESIRNKPDVARVVVLALGGVAGACGLVLAARRSTKFSEQVDTAQKQLFNEQLGRGAELLTKKEMVMLRAGIRVLGNLAEKTMGEPEQVKLIMQIIYDFVRSKTKPPLEAKETEAKETEVKETEVKETEVKETEDKETEDKETEDKETEDKEYIVLGIRTLGSLYNKVDKSGQSDEFRKLLEFQGFNLEGVNFSDAKLQEANFWSAKLQGANFANAELQDIGALMAELQGADFWKANLQRARLGNANLQGAHFHGANLQGAFFIFAELQGAHFSGAELQGAIFYHAKLQGADFERAELQRADFNSAELQGANCTDTDFSHTENLTEAQVKGMVFEVNRPPRLPDDIEQFLDLNRRYEWKIDPSGKSNRRYFVQPDVNAKESEKWEWSGKPVDEYITSIRNPEDDG